MTVNDGEEVSTIKVNNSEHICTEKQVYTSAGVTDATAFMKQSLETNALEYQRRSNDSQTCVGRYE